MLTWVSGRSDRRTERSPLAGRWLRAGAVLAGLALLGVSAPASAQTLTWSVVPSPSPAVRFNSLVGVSCVSADACVAVGGHGNRFINDTLAESWNGARWSVVSSPDPATVSSLAAVSCVSADACTAVGSYQTSNGYATLVESWNGTSWSVVPSPSPGGGDLSVLTGVSCASAGACVAVGYDYTASAARVTLVESWNGTVWSVVPSPSPGGGDTLYGVSCASADACMAVGSYAVTGSSMYSTLAESWNGTAWSVVASPSPSPGYGDYLYGVSCVSAATCTAVGQRGTTDAGVGDTLAESWNGTTWSVVHSPDRAGTNSNLNSVSCTSATACTAAGADHPAHGGTGTVIESWNGTSWSVVPSPNRGSQSEFDGVSCAPATPCTAVGYRNTTADPSDFKTLIETGPATG